jgi:hypothetical protein
VQAEPSGARGSVESHDNRWGGSKGAVQRCDRTAEHRRASSQREEGKHHDRQEQVEIPKSGGRIEAQLMPPDEPLAPVSVKLGKSGHVVYKLPAMLRMGFRIVECTPGELAIMESHGITLTGGRPPLVRWSTG